MKRRGFTLAEAMVVMVIAALFVALVATNLGGAFSRNTFKSKAQGLVSALEMASTSAAQSDKRYEVIIDIPQQSYTLRQITSPDLSQVLEEQQPWSIIVERMSNIVTIQPGEAQIIWPRSSDEIMF